MSGAGGGAEDAFAWLRYLPALAALAAAVYAYGVLNAEVRSLTEWRQTAQTDSFSEKDGQVLEKRLQSEIDRLRVVIEADLRNERAFARSICVSLRHTQEVLGHVPTNDCARP